ncbi:hypothetical protein STAQ_33760 [Allostella sp. ATCC 35155]|nr:hypothetical protein STAQ_33760 [Stella sp. ATCC 35155]
MTIAAIPEAFTPVAFAVVAETAAHGLVLVGTYPTRRAARGALARHARRNAPDQPLHVLPVRAIR